MATVVANMSMSLDGFVAAPDDGVEQLFGWYGSGDVETPTRDPRWTFRTSQASAERLRQAIDSSGALVCGRRLFDLTNGWDGHHPMGVPVFVVTHQAPSDWAHPEAPVTFVTDGVTSAVEQARTVAGDRVVAVASANVAAQCLDAGLLDEVHIDLVPVLLGTGIPFFAGLVAAPVRFENPAVVQGDGVTHLSYRVRR
jgi:dihydrofolate reductase